MPDRQSKSYAVGLVAPEFPPDIGGVETYSFELAKALIALGHEVTVFTVAHPDGEVDLPRGTVVPLLRQRRRLDWPQLRQYRVDVWHATNAAYAWLALETPNVVVSVHGNDFLRPYIDVARPDLAKAPLLWRMNRRTASSISRLDHRLGHWLTHRLVARSLPAARCLIANSRYTEETLLKHYPECKGHTSVGLVGVDSRFFATRRPARQPGQPRRLLTVCRLSEPRKNVEMVLRSLALLRERHSFEYTVVGDGALRPRLQELARQLHLEDVVRFTGALSSSELLRQFAAADLFVLTAAVLRHSHEGFGIVYLEANAAGTPVLAANLAGASEAVENGVSGLLVDRLSAQEIADAIESVLASKVTFDPDACRSFAARFTWERVARHCTDRYAAAYAATNA